MHNTSTAKTLKNTHKESHVMYPPLALSVVVPLYNEAGNVKRLHEQIMESCTNLGKPFEILFVDDGSTDDTGAISQTLSPLTLISFRKNFGQTAAFDAGIKRARGDIIITLDGDLQNDPKDIPRLLKKITEGYDVVSGWRWSRQDNVGKRITSRTANMLRTFFFRDKIHDSGCALKAYRRECFDDLDLYGEIHRFIPALLESRGFKVTEIKVLHHPRQNGTSKYDNLRRGIKSLVDMISVWFWDKFSSRPAHLFGSLGLFSALIGIMILGGMIVARAVFGIPIADRIWPLIGVFLFLSGVQFFTLGILADILIKNYYHSHQRMNYFIRDITYK